MQRLFGLGSVCFALLSANCAGPGTPQRATSATVGAEEGENVPALTAPAGAIPTAASSQAACSSDRVVEGLRESLEHVHGLAGLQKLEASFAGCPGVKRTSLIDGSHPSLFVELAEPVDAAKAAIALGIENPFLITTTVHQESFRLVDSSMPAGGARVFSPDELRVAEWDVRTVARRPKGPLPKDRFGPAPAYDLRSYSSVVTHVSISAPR